MIKKIFVLFVLGSLNASLFTTYISAQKNEPFKTYTFPASSINMLESTMTNGNITVTGGAGEVLVEMLVSGNSPRIRRKWSDEEIKQYLEENYTIEVKIDSEKLLATARLKNDGKKGKNYFSISFRIAVPRQMSTNLKTTNGSIQISNLSGSQKFQTVNGSLKVENISGKISGSTVNGSITVTNSKDDINLNTVNGSIAAKDCDGKIILNTVNGRVKRENAGEN